MPKHIVEYDSKHAAFKLFSLVADIEKYPEFLPWCVAARITAQHENVIYAELVIGYKGLCEKYSSKVTLIPPSNAKDEAIINVEMVEGPFTHLVNLWTFAPSQNESGCHILFSIDFAFRSKMLKNIIGIFFDEAVKKMVIAFEERADKLFG
jgi:coenzyme Q-binding protein COQ10